MSKRLNLEFDSALLDSISAEFDLRLPNKEALRKLVYTLNGDYDPNVMQVMNMATGVGKTYLMAAFMEYLRLQGVGNVVIITPGKVVQAKTIQNFTHGSPRYIEGSQVPPEIVTPQDYSAWIARVNGTSKLSYGRDVPELAFIFNIQQLIAPTDDEGSTHGEDRQSQRRKPRRYDENAGILFDYLKDLEDLVVIADESHLYGVSAAAFHKALEELDPAACIGLTASTHPGDHVIYRYPLYQAIKDQYVKTPVLAFRKEGYGDDGTSEEQQLSDATQLREIKQHAYDAYTEQNGLPHLNAVLFVVCSDKNHATQITELLRSPRFFGSAQAVLQIDSDHEDVSSQLMLERLDDADSPVLAVVSVNKLKEGWDVKNIAVIVTLRAMASEVLTQQTMGRGLRLPFGKYTGILQIDQLDIIAHQSFKELLEAENVLEQFGLEEATKDMRDTERKIKDAIVSGMSGNTTGRKGAVEYTTANGEAATEPDSLDGDESNGHADETQIDTDWMKADARQGGLFDGIGLMRIDEQGPAKQPSLSCTSVKRNKRFSDVEYMFPRTRIDLSKYEVDLAGIDEESIKKASERVTSTVDVIIRKRIITSISGRLKVADTESAEVDSRIVDSETAENTLVRIVLSGQLITVNKENELIARRYLVRKFMRYAPVDNWTVKSLSSASDELERLINGYVKELQSRRVEETSFSALKMPCTEELKIPVGDEVHASADSQADFVRGRFYGNWMKSLFDAESFDSYTGEYLLAKLLDTSPNIVWWQRLHTDFGAYIYYNSRSRYYPDFVACDDSKTLWIIEGKAQRGQDDTTVQAKRLAAEQVVHRMVGESAFANQYWGYLIAYEDDIRNSDSWNDLKAKTHPASNA